MVITVNFKDGGITRFTMNPSEQHEGDSCGTVEHVEISDLGLVWRPRVIKAITGEMRLPTLARNMKSVSETPPPVCCSLGTKTTTTTEFYEFDYNDEFVLLPPQLLANVVEINIDGVLAYTCDAQGKLVCPTDNVEVVDMDGGLEPAPARRPGGTPKGDSSTFAPDAIDIEPARPAAEEYLRSVLENFDL